VLLMTVIGASLISVAGLTAIGYLLWGPTTEGSTEPLQAIALEAPILQPDEGIVRDQTAFEDLTLAARSALVWDAKEESVLFARDATTPLPLASVGKLMTAYTALSVLPPEAPVPILPGALATEGDSGLLAFEEWAAEDLAAFMLITSSNDAAQALAAAAGHRLRGTGTPLVELSEGQEAAARLRFVEQMNAHTDELSLINTRFRNATGLDLSPSEPGSEGTVRDVARLVEALMREHPDLLLATREPGKTLTTRSGFTHEAENTNANVDDVPGLIGSKTGFTDLAGGNLAVAVDADLAHPLIIVVLGSSIEERFTDVAELTEAGRAYLTGV
jgi:D-alanyl-D-alanine carboxypeptidase (penicillin-binding protein 5/6)